MIDREHKGAAVTINSEMELIQRFRREIVERQWQIGAVTMMLPVGVHQILNRPVEYFSFVRDPVKRCISAINFVYSKRDTHPISQLYSSYGWSLSRIVASGDLDYQNDQVRMLSGSNKITVDRSDLETAKDNILNRFFIVGTTESLPIAWRKIADRYGFLFDGSRKKNKGNYSEGLEFNQADIDAVLQANQLDAELYEWVRREYLPDRHGIADSSTIA
jgi:hypothetical protein